MAKRAPTRSDHLRTAVAQEAARLMAEHGIQDFLLAKRKAAERYGVADGTLLPRNSEIEAALVTHQRLFGGARHENSLQQKRRVAVQAMALLKPFEPRLVGAVLNGTATEYSDIQLHVFSDTAETVYLHLTDRRYEYEVFERKMKLAVERWIAIPSVRFDMELHPVEAFVFPTDGIRQSPLSAVDGRPMRRVAALEAASLAGLE